MSKKKPVMAWAAKIDGEIWSNWIRSKKSYIPQLVFPPKHQEIIRVSISDSYAQQKGEEIMKDLVREALEFYADQKTYQACKASFEGPEIITHADMDAGAKARKCLAALSEREKSEDELVAIIRSAWNEAGQRDGHIRFTIRVLSDAGVLAVRK